MDKTTVMDQWQELSRRLDQDKALLNVLDSLADVLSEADSRQCRGRLKVPYANAASFGSQKEWVQSV